MVGNQGDPFAHGLWNGVKNGLKRSNHYNYFKNLMPVANWRAGFRTIRDSSAHVPSRSLGVNRSVFELARYMSTMVFK